jgi:hypothetical protein
MTPTSHDTERGRTELRRTEESPPPEVAAFVHADEGRTCRSTVFRSLLSSSGGDDELGTEPVDRSFAFDLNLDQVIEHVAGEREERDLIVALLYRQLRDPETVRFRQEVFEDLHGSVLLEGVKASVEQLRQVRSHLSQLAKMQLLAIIEFRVLRSSNVAVQDQRKSRSGIIGCRGWRGGALRG